MDRMHRLGTLALASRLKRLSDRLYRDVARVYRELDTAMEPRWFPILHLLSRNAPLSVTEIAGELGLTHSAVHQTAATMESRGIIGSRKERGDARRRLLTLTAKGKRLVRRLGPVWEVIRLQSERLLAEGDDDFLGALDRIERALDERGMYERLQGEIPGLASEEPEILPYRPAYKKWFRRLNEEWLEEHFTVEPKDERILADPNGRILHRGGEILFARVGKEIVGTVAILPVDEESVELTKMAVTVKWRGRGIGRRLGEEAVRVGRGMGARRIVLHTSPRLKAAIRLYRSIGFVRDRTMVAESIPYRRETIRMVRTLRGQRKNRGGNER